MRSARPSFLIKVVAPLTFVGTAAACDPGDSPQPLAGPAPADPAPADQLSAEEGEPLAACGDVVNLDLRRSLVVSEIEALAPFTFTRVMQQIVSTAQEPGLTPTLLYQRWWDYFNAAPGLFPDALHCDDVLVEGQPGLGAFPAPCPRPEGVLAATDPFSNPNNNPDAYVALGVFNRFDLAPLDGSNCGEFRIVFAKRSGLTDGGDRNLIIFEAALPNPKPSCGLAGCRPIAQFWADLSAVDDILEIRDRIEHFYFTDAEGAGPVVHADNYGTRGGQIRTNQFMNGPNIWQLRQFIFDHECAAGPCIRPTAVKDSAFRELFQDGSPWKGADVFQTWFLGQVPNLSQPDLNGFFLREIGTFNAGASTSDDPSDDLRSQLGDGFRSAIEAAITEPGLTADHILNRATALSCSGCHHHSNEAETADLGGGLTWPPSLDFVHISETFTVVGPFGTRFPLSDALRFVFLPHRGQILEDFLASTACDACNGKGVKDLSIAPEALKGMTLGGPRSGH